jgi:hypothetical protein
MHQNKQPFTEWYDPPQKNVELSRMTLLKCTVVPSYKYLVPGTTFDGTLFLP